MPSGENWMLALSRSSPFGHGIVRTTLCVREVVLDELGRPDLEPVRVLGRRADDHHDEAVLRVWLERLDSHQLVALG